MSSIFFTGFPGFLGSELLPRVVLRTDHDAVCLVQPKFRAMAEARARQLEVLHPALANRIHLVEGDLTEPLDHVAAEDVREIYHLAVVYDLAVPRELAMRVNVTGTRRVLDLAARAGRLERLHYVSTCYVSGRHAGTFTEDELEVGQSFNNFYEETKYLAEVEVRRRMNEIPATVYRPAVVVGDSLTGATQKPRPQRVGQLPLLHREVRRSGCSGHDPDQGGSTRVRAPVDAANGGEARMSVRSGERNCRKCGRAVRTEPATSSFLGGTTFVARLARG